MYAVTWSGKVLGDLGRVWDESPRLQAHLLAARGVMSTTFGKTPTG